MRIRILVFSAVLMISLSLAALGYAQTGSVYFKEEFNYSSLDQMQTGGWTFTRPAGISVATSAVTLDGTGGDCALHHPASFSKDVFDWKAEVKTMWLGHGHSVLSVFLATDHHAYGWAADGYYKEFSFYRDSKKILHFGIYQEKANQYVVLAMVRQGNTFSFYFNGELKNTYAENDTGPAKLSSLDLVSPWKGDAKYDYYIVGESTAVSPASTATDTTNSQFPIIPVAIGGTIAGVAVAGVLVYYFFIAGSGAGAAAGSAGAGAAGTAGGAGSVGSAGGGELIHHDHPASPPSAELPLNQLSGSVVGLPLTECISNIMQSMGISQDIVQTILNGNLGDLNNMVQTVGQNLIQNLASGNPGNSLGNFMMNMAQTSTSASSGSAGAATNPVQVINSLYDQLTSQGEQLVQEGTTQGSINQDSYQQYLEHFTNMVDFITQTMNTTTSTNMDAVHSLE